MLDVRLSAWVPPGVRVKALDIEDGIEGVGDGDVDRGRRRIIWSSFGSCGGILVRGWDGMEGAGGVSNVNTTKD